ncbi:signal peptidase I [Chryseolinea soli]|uniref:Signal peptidase I n=1 Tax=Chryseolinea soli TaxID=2321403 RepID=A0A385SUP9_9BACT|nr:signal peptidase I [Chryseolinea soli]AYB34582.1 signal peptidase I [Chryseolinea soli]
MNDLETPVSGHEESPKKKKPALAAFLNFIVPGLGYVYAGNIKRGVIAYFLLILVAVISIRFVAYTFTLFLVGIGLIIAFYVYLIVSGYRAVGKAKHQETKRWDVWYVYVLVIAAQVGLRPFLQSIHSLGYLSPITPVVIPTPAMDPTLQIGDHLMFHKTKTIARNNIIVFKWPPDQKIMYIKRCVGMPGDTLSIRKAAVFVNGDSLTGDYMLKYRYAVQTDGVRIQQRVLDQFGIAESEFYDVGSGSYSMFLTQEQARQVRGLPFIKFVEREMTSEDELEPDVYPQTGSGQWNKDNFGPLYLPKKGDRIPLTHRNLALYGTCLKYENESVELLDSAAIINGKQIDTYAFKDNYYFMMGDNRHNSLDSRYWGFVAESMVLGKALYFYWSKDWDRIGTSIR